MTLTRLLQVDGVRGEDSFRRGRHFWPQSQKSASNCCAVTHPQHTDACKTLLIKGLVVSHKKKEPVTSPSVLPSDDSVFDPFSDPSEAVLFSLQDKGVFLPAFLRLRHKIFFWLFSWTLNWMIFLLIKKKYCWLSLGFVWPQSSAVGGYISDFGKNNHYRASSYHLPPTTHWFFLCMRITF